VSEIDVAYDDAQLYKHGGWTQVCNLETRGFHSVSLWVKRNSRTTTTFADVPERVVSSPGKAQIDQEELVSKRPNKVADPLKHTIEVLALTHDEVKKLLRKFEELDKDKKAVVSADAFVAKFGCSVVAHALFALLGSLDHSGDLNFGEFTKALGTFCCFDTKAVLQLVFNIHADRSLGVVTVASIKELAYCLHGEAGSASLHRLRKPLSALDQGDEPLSIAKFHELHKKSPILLFPVFQFQQCLRQYVFGESWWNSRLKRFQALREKAS
jgi:Ca2+-binding EF-hand superfamily protein